MPSAPDPSKQIASSAARATLTCLDVGATPCAIASQTATETIVKYRNVCGTSEHLGSAFCHTSSYTNTKMPMFLLCEDSLAIRLPAHTMRHPWTAQVPGRIGMLLIKTYKLRRLRGQDNLHMATQKRARQARSYASTLAASSPS